ESQAAVDRLDAEILESGSKMVATVKEETAKYWSWREELNLQPVVYKTTALPLSYASPFCFSHTWRGGSSGERGVAGLSHPCGSQLHRSRMDGRRGRLRWVGRSGAMAVTDIAMRPGLPRLTMFLVAVLLRSRHSMPVELTAVVVCFQPYPSHKCVDRQIVQSDA